MDENPKLPATEPTAAPAVKSRFFAFPRTKLGWLAAGLALGSLLLQALTHLIALLVTSLSHGAQGGTGLNLGILTVVLSIAGGILGVLAVVRNKERSILVWYAILAGLFALLLIITDLVFAL